MEVICTTFPHRRRELGDYLAIIAELALSYGGSHFYTYHKLFSAKCAIRVAQWNQCPYWGALDNELHNRVFLGCRNITCAVCRSISHSTTICPFINPSIPPLPRTIPAQIHQLRTTHHKHPLQPPPLPYFATAFLPPKARSAPASTPADALDKDAVSCTSAIFAAALTAA